MKVRYTPQAARDLEEVFGYIARDNPAAAARTIDRIEGLARLIGQVPFAGRRGRIAGTREIVVSGLPYILVYRVRRAAVEIVAVVHGARLK